MLIRKFNKLFFTTFNFFKRNFRFSSSKTIWLAITIQHKNKSIKIEFYLEYYYNKK